MKVLLGSVILVLRRGLAEAAMATLLRLGPARLAAEEGIVLGLDQLDELVDGHRIELAAITLSWSNQTLLDLLSTDHEQIGDLHRARIADLTIDLVTAIVDIDPNPQTEQPLHYPVRILILNIRDWQEADL